MYLTGDLMVRHSLEMLGAETGLSCEDKTLRGLDVSGLWMFGKCTSEAR